MGKREDKMTALRCTHLASHLKDLYNWTSTEKQLIDSGFEYFTSKFIKMYRVVEMIIKWLYFFDLATVKSKSNGLQAFFL